MLIAERLFFVHRVAGFHPLFALFLYLAVAALCIWVLMAVASSRGRSSMWSLFGLWLIPGLVIGLLVLIALPANTASAPGDPA
jgi:hypothetical protein